MKNPEFKIGIFLVVQIGLIVFNLNPREFPRLAKQAAG